MRALCKPTFVAVLLSTTVGVNADDSKFELTPYGAYRFGGSIDVEDSSGTFETADAASFGLLFNIRKNSNTQWEVLYSKQDTDADYSEALPGDPNTGVKIQVLQLGGTYQGEGEKVRPYLAATIGGTHIEATTDGSESDTFFSASIGVGVQISPGSRLGLRLEARAYGTIINSSTDLFCRTGPSANVCAARVDGELLSQIETFAGIVFRF